VVNALSNYGGGGLLAGGTPRALVLASGAPVALNGAWEYRLVPTTFGYPPRTPWESVGGLTTLYNAMIAPLGDYGFKGAVWYQGESNTGEADTYQGLLSGLMADWRHRFGAGLAFLVVELPNYGSQPVAPGESGWAGVREAQRQAVAHDPHAGLAVTIDVGDAHNLHPGNKQDVGRRLARAARHVIYGETVTPSGPVPRSASRSTDQVVVQFDDIDGGLVAYSHEAPIGFELCADSVGSCRYVEARIRNTQVQLTVPNATSPSRVRYCWADSPVCTLFDRSGLPAGPFELRISP
jgi:sialate O-acetylesterase